MDKVSKTVTKAELAKSISTLGLSLRYSHKLVDFMVQELINSLEKSEVIHLVGFGSFRYKVRKARTGRNPKTGEVVNVPDKKIIQFKPGNKLKDRIRGSFKNEAVSESSGETDGPEQAGQ